MKKLFRLSLVFALLLAFAFPSISSRVNTPARSMWAFITGGIIDTIANVESVDTVDTVTEIANIVDVTAFLIEVAKGNVEGHSIITKFGTNPSTDILDAPETVWDGSSLYAFHPTTAQIMEVVSTDVDDTGVVLSSGIAEGGSIVTLEDVDADFVTDTVAIGDIVINDSNDQFAIITAVAATVLTHAAINNGSQENFQSTPNASGDTYRIAHANDTGLAVGVVYGLDGDYLDITEIYVLNGTTVVPLTQTFIAQHRMTGLIAGTVAGNEGAVISRITGGGTVAAQMLAGANKTLMAVYTVPAGKIGYFLKGYVGITKTGNPASVNTAQFTWRVIPFGSVESVNGIVETITSGSSWWIYEYNAIPGVPPQTFIHIRVDDVSHDATGTVAGFGLMLVDFGA
jgi:hypothetical protein